MAKEEAKELESVPEVIEPEIVSSGHSGDSRQDEARYRRGFVKVYRPGPLSGLLFVVAGLAVAALTLSFGVMALLAGAAVGVLWLVLSPLLRLFGGKR